jgi:hypothetical protein
MKLSALAAACLFFSTLVRAECVEVTTATPRSLSYQQSSQNARIAVALDGKPAPGAQIDILTARNYHLRFSITTDIHGLAALPTLVPEQYHVVATATDKQRGESYLAESFLGVYKGIPGSVGWVFLDLVPVRQVQLLELPTLEQALFGGARRTTPIGRISGFQGFVIDPSGAGIPGATIKVFPTGSSDESHVIETETDQTGRFSVSLPEGTYTVVVHMQAFRPQAMDFEIAQGAEATVAKITLNVAWC